VRREPSAVRVAGRSCQCADTSRCSRCRHAQHSDDATPCYPLLVEIYKPADGALEGWVGSPARSSYSGNHGL
jgi:hypothetical protein